MKMLKTFLAPAILSLASLSLSAQTQSIAYGRTTIQFGASFQQLLSGLGASVTDLKQNSLKNGSVVFVETGGVIDLRTATAEISHNGGYIFTANGTALTAQDLVIDASNPAAITVTALLTVNNTFLGRIPFFLLQAPGVSLPLTPQSGVETIAGFRVTFAPAGANAVNSVYGGQFVQAGAAVGTADVYAVFAAQ